MKLDRQKNYIRRNHMRGFSMLELVIVMVVAMIITAVALPSFLQAYRTYQLNDAATQVAAVLKFTRYEAIRLNVGNVGSATPPLSTQIRQAGGNITNIFTDSNYSGTVQNNDKQVQLTGNVNLVAAAVPPNTGGLAAAVGVAALTNVSIINGAVAFDARGAVTPAAVDVVYVGNLALPALGYRAVVLLPSGSVQIWTTDLAGNWRQLN